jgi:hypothetical protein
MNELLPAFVTPDHVAQDVDAFLAAIKPEPTPSVRQLLTALEMRKPAGSKRTPKGRSEPEPPVVRTKVKQQPQKPEIVPIRFLREDR